MARAILLLSSTVRSRPFAGRTLLEHLTRTCEAAGLPEPLVSSPEETLRVEGPVLLVDGRFPAVAAPSLHHLVTVAGSPAALLARQGEVIAVALSALEEARPLGAHLVATGPEDVVAPAEEALSDLSAAERAVRRRHVDALAQAGVRFVDPERVVVDPTVTVAAGCEIWPDVVLRGETRLEEEVVVHSGAWIEDTHLEAGALVRAHSVCTGARVGGGATVGPFAHLRTGAVLEARTRVGNFVEVKKAILREGAKANHLAYLGDAEIGAGANVGAGTITCNYDGVSKHVTRIAAGAFIGSNTALVAPVTVGEGAIVAAGSVVVRDVPADALYLERAEPTVLEGKASKIRARARERARATEGEGR